MKKVSFIIFLLLVPALSFSQPSIHFKSVIHDFGMVEPDDAIQYLFEFSNVGDQDLIIEKIAPS